MSDFNFYEANTNDVLDTRDIIARIEELRTERESYLEDNAGDEEAYARTEDGGELTACEELMAEMAGRGGDEQWEGTWYPVTMIRDSYFEDAMDEMLEDIGALQPFEDRPSFINITIDYLALQQDYGSVEVDGVTYWFR
jgi:hypothetical protein